MSLFLPFVLALAVFWLLIGVMLAKFLAQKYRNKPWRTREVDSSFVFGGAVGRDRSRGVVGAYELGRGEGLGLGRFGRGGVKGL